MTLAAQVSVDIRATKTAQSGLASVIDQHQMSLSANVADCTEVWSERRTIGALGYEDVDISEAGVSGVKLLCVKNISANNIALSAGWSGNEFRTFLPEGSAWDFSPIINLGGGSLRGLPIRPGGVYLLSCPNSIGFPVVSGGGLLRIGGINGAEFEIYILGN